jgi:small subunit ribosomal protein S6
MNKYEVLYILVNEIEDDAKTQLVDKFSSAVTNLGGTVDKIDKWGTKRFAYPINFKNDGYYVLMTFTANPEVSKELERLLRITDNVVRHMVIRLS